MWLNRAIQLTMFNQLHFGCEYFGCESFNYKTYMNKNKHSNIKIQTSADVGKGNGEGLGRVRDTGQRQPQVCKQVNNTL